VPRLFVAADISDATRRAFHRVREQLQARLTYRKAPRLVWVGDDAAHVTLRFIGAVTDLQASRIEEVLAPAFELPAFDLEWATLGTFPPGRSPRVVWIGATSDLDPMRRLATLVNARINPVVPNDDMRPYSPHLTIARVKDPGRGVNWTAALGAVALDPSVSRVDHVTLYESRVTSKGSTYTVRMRAPLA
jgi:2'-5' RNA ligase